jgi:N-acyl homoserine lactone hydrolase
VGSWIRNILAFVALLLGFFIWSFTPTKLFLAPLETFAIPQANPPAGMSIAAIESGELQDRAIFAFRGGRWSDQRTFRMGGILVRHPRGMLLFDTGFGSHVDAHVASLDFVMKSVAHYRKGRPVAAQLTAAGIDPKKLQAVVLTHAHWDHVSGLEDLPGVPIWVTQPELDFIHDGGSATALARSFGALPYVAYGFPNGPYLGFAHSRDVYGDGSVVLVPAFGHTPGSIIAFISLPGGAKYALVGDLVWQKEGIELPAERPWPVRLLVDSNAAHVRELIVHVRQIVDRIPALVVVPAHDARVWRAMPKL